MELPREYCSAHNLDNSVVVVMVTIYEEEEVVFRRDHSDSW